MNEDPATPPPIRKGRRWNAEGRNSGAQPRVRHQFSQVIVTVDGEEWEFTMKANGLIARRPGGRKEERADWVALLDACLKQQRLPLV